MSQPAGIENNGGQGQGLNDQGTAPGNDGGIQFGQLNQQQPPPQQFGAPQASEPPYQEYLNKIPESLRPAIEPIFREWDANTTQRFQGYSNQLQQLQPYQQFTQYDPQALQLAVQLANMVQEQPEQVFQMLADQLNYDLESDEDEDGSYYGQTPGGNPQEDERWHAMEQALSQLTELVQGDRQQREEDQETERILSDLAAVEQQRGPLDYDFVLGKAYATGDLNGAVEEWYSRYAQAAPQQQQFNGNGQQPQQMVTVGGLQVPANHPAAQQGPPQPLASGGGLPSETKDLGSLTPKERIALVAQTINAANQAGQG